MRAAGRLTIFSLNLYWFISFVFASVIFSILCSLFLGDVHFFFLLRILHVSRFILLAERSRGSLHLCFLFFRIAMTIRMLSICLTFSSFILLILVLLLR